MDNENRHLNQPTRAPNLNGVTRQPSWQRRLLSGLCLGLAACASQLPHPEIAEANPAPPKAAPAAKPRPLSGADPERIQIRFERELQGRGVAVAVSRRLDRVVAATEKNPARLYRFQDGKNLAISASCTDILRAGLWLEGEQLIIACESALQIFDAKSLKQLPSPELAESRVTAAALAWPWLALGHRDGVIRIHNLSPNQSAEAKILKEIKIPGPPIDVKSLALTPDGGRLAVAWVQGSIWLFDVESPDTPQDLARYDNESDTLAFDPTGHLLAEEGQLNTTHIWDFREDINPRYQHPSGSWVKRMSFDKKSEWLFRGGSHGVDLIRIESDERVFLSRGNLVEDLAMSEDKSALAAIDRGGKLTLWADAPSP